MKKRRAVLMAVASFVVGAGGAAWLCLAFNAKFANYALLARTQADIGSRVAVLEHLRAGRVADATTLLETLLDGDLIGAGALARDGAKFNANARRAVEREFQARAASGYTPTDEDLRNAVQDAFRILAAGSEGVTTHPSVPPDPPPQAAPGR